DNGIAISDLADDLYQFGSLTVALTYLVCDCERRPEVLRESACPLGEAGIGRDDDKISQFRTRDRCTEIGHCVEVVDRYSEEPLDLRGVQIERHHSICSRCLDRIGADPRAD